jgi:hypothetical protein
VDALRVVALGKRGSRGVVANVRPDAGPHGFRAVVARPEHKAADGYQLPAYVHELNPAEGVWAHLKRQQANLAARGVNDLAVTHFSPGSHEKAQTGGPRTLKTARLRTTAAPVSRSGTTSRMSPAPAATAAARRTAMQTASGSKWPETSPPAGSNVARAGPLEKAGTE